MAFDRFFHNFGSLESQLEHLDTQERLAKRSYHAIVNTAEKLEDRVLRLIEDLRVAVQERYEYKERAEKAEKAAEDAKQKLAALIIALRHHSGKINLFALGISGDAYARRILSSLEVTVNQEVKTRIFLYFQQFPGQRLLTSSEIAYQLEIDILVVELALGEIQKSGLIQRTDAQNSPTGTDLWNLTQIGKEFINVA